MKGLLLKHAQLTATELSDVGTTKVHALGSLYDTWDGTIGRQVWRYIFNDEASTAFAAGTVLKWDVGTSPKLGDAIVAPVNTPRNGLCGVAQHAIAAGSYGWVLVQGQGLVLAGTETIDLDMGVYVSSAVVGCGANATQKVTAERTSANQSEEGLAGPFAWASADAASTATALCLIDIPL